MPKNIIAHPDNTGNPGFTPQSPNTGVPRPSPLTKCGRPRPSISLNPFQNPRSSKCETPVRQGQLKTEVWNSS